MKLVFDMSSVLWTCLRAGKSGEFGKEVDHNGKKVWVNGWQHGYENAINHMVTTFNTANLRPVDAILVFEGKSSKSRRLMIDQSYKASRGDKPQYEYEQFQILRDKLGSVFRGLGANAVYQDFVEGDDVIGWLARNTEEDMLIDSNDGDLAVLSGVNDYGANVVVQARGKVGNPFGEFPVKYITLYKALVGDSSDNIKGCPGFGPAAWTELLTGFGEQGLEDLHNLLVTKGSLDDLAEDAESDKLVARIYAQRDTVVRSWKLATIHHEWINTLQNRLVWTVGMVGEAPEHPDERLVHWYGKKYLVTAKNFAQVSAWAKPKIEASEFCGLDIETSTGEDSDAWAEQITGGDARKTVVDVLDSKLTGLSITFGANREITLYFSVDHADTDNIPSETLKEFILGCHTTWAIQNAAGFELPVLKLNWGVFLPNVLDTRIEACYVDENRDSHGLKQLSKDWLGYDQTTYEAVTTVEETLEDGSVRTVQKKMRELTAQHVFDYACDDTITCSAIHTWTKLLMQLEHQYDVYLGVEIDAMYMGAQGFLNGANISRKRLAELTEEDDKVYDAAWGDFSKKLVEWGWAGTVPPTYTKSISAAEAKEAFAIVAGEALDTRARLIPKLAEAARAQNQLVYAALLENCIASDEGAERFTNWVRTHFKGQPEWKSSPAQKGKVMYERLGLPIRLRNPATDIMKSKGITEGNPKTDALSIAYALKFDVADNEDIKKTLHQLQEMQIVSTRRGLYYKPYPDLIHWLTNKVHSSIQQSSTNTRRATAAKPNVQQMSKHPKAEGETPKLREIIVPHKKNAVVVSFDFAAQELRVIADYSRDENMLACFVGNSLKDMHSLTAVGILQRMGGQYANITYEEFMANLKSPDKATAEFFKEIRALGKKVNFTTEYGAMAPKLAQTLIILEDEAQAYIDAKEAAFPGARVWKDSVIEEAKQYGIVRTMEGAVRHLADALTSDDRYESSKAERQAVNFKVQSSSAEMAKKAIGRMWQEGIQDRFDCRYYFPVHDEVVWSCAIEDLFEFVPAVHACMVAPYGGMTVPIVSSIAFGRSFGPADQIEIGEAPTREAIQAGLDKMAERGHLEATVAV